METKFTEIVATAIEQAFQQAQSKNHTELTEKHLLCVLSEDPKGYFASIVAELGGDIAKLHSLATEAVNHCASFAGSPGQPSTSQELQRVLFTGQEVAKRWSDSYTGVDHLFLAFWQLLSGPFFVWKEGLNLSVEAVEEKLKTLRGNRRIDSPSAESSFQAIEKYCNDLTSLAKEGKLDPVIGRDEEIRRCIQILGHRTKNNPMLIGEPGVGKTAIAEGLAWSLAASSVTQKLI